MGCSLLARLRINAGIVLMETARDNFMPDLSLQIKNKVGLHARPASLFVQTAGRFKSSITVTLHDETVNAKSILSILTLGADQGVTITVHAEGEDAPEALQAISALAENNFGEKE